MLSQRSPEQEARATAGTRLANWNHCRRLIGLARTLADMDEVDATMTVLSVDDDLRLNQWFEDASRRIAHGEQRRR